MVRRCPNSFQHLTVLDQSGTVRPEEDPRRAVSYTPFHRGLTCAGGKCPMIYAARLPSVHAVIFSSLSF
ncbi:hypothetical protein Y032_0094g2778 [Ancylostoma ceylanicum]|uniref:Uncharacterized protein n=1 Tax=Ancylostoma ceylanicum TaxID=53326 RepID=A0A016TLA0_9BILA|nr:hypothetical protein Y032_0094g2778 [Ancylostoma ceylanicum]